MNRAEVNRHIKEWISNELNLSVSKGNRIELTDNEIVIRISKSNITYGKEFILQAPIFKLDDTERKYFLGFMIYGVNPFANIPKDLELWVIDFEKIEPVRGKEVRYVRLSDVQKYESFNRFARTRGVIYIPEKSILEERLFS